MLKIFKRAKARKLEMDRMVAINNGLQYYNPEDGLFYYSASKEVKRAKVHYNKVNRVKPTYNKIKRTKWGD